STRNDRDGLPGRSHFRESRREVANQANKGSARNRARAGIERKKAMRRSMWVIVVSALWLPWTVVANQDLLTRQTDDNQWALPSKNYAGTRYSSLDQINAGNIKNLHQVWSFSTGALRGHEGQPLVVGSTMYVHSAYPN